MGFAQAVAGVAEARSSRLSRVVGLRFLPVRVPRVDATAARLTSNSYIARVSTEQGDAQLFNSTRVSQDVAVRWTTLKGADNATEIGTLFARP